MKGCATQEAVLLPPMQEWPIDWSDDRKRLAAKYFEFHKGWELGADPDYDALTTMDPKMIAVHWTVRVTKLAPHWNAHTPQAVASHWYSTSGCTVIGMHSKPPSVLTQSALASQGLSEGTAHSLTSVHLKPLPE